MKYANSSSGLLPMSSRLWTRCEAQVRRGVHPHRGCGTGSRARVTVAAMAIGVCLWNAPSSIVSASPAPARPSAHGTPQTAVRVPGSPVDETANQEEDDWYAELIGPIDPPRGVLNEDLEWQGNVAVLELTSESTEATGEHDLGPYRVIEYESDFTGTLYVSASTLVVDGTADPWVRLVDLDATTLAEDDDSGGGNAALVEYEIEGGEYLEIHVGVHDGEAPALVGFKVLEGSETEQTDALATALSEARATAREALNAGDHEGARAIVRAAVDGWIADASVNSSAAVAHAARSLGRVADDAHDSGVAARLWAAWMRFEERAHPAEHADLQAARGNLALTMKQQGDLLGVRLLEQQVLAVRERTLPAEHPDLLAARLNLAVTMNVQGDLPGARALFEQVLAVCERTLPADHRGLQAARLNLALTMKQQGDLPGARALQERALAAFERTLPPDHPDLQRARGNLAVTLSTQGDLPGARALLEQVLAVREQMLPANHRDLQVARLNLAATMKTLGDLPGARALEEQVLEVFERTLPAAHRDLQVARQGLALTMSTQGDLVGARALEEQILAISERTLPGDHPDLQTARQNLARTILSQGDLTRARALDEQVLAVRERTLPADHPDLQAARGNLAVSLSAQGDLRAARALQEQVVAVRERTLPAHHPDLLAARSNLAVMLSTQGDLPGARMILQQVLAVHERTLPGDHPDLQAVRCNLAVTMRAEGDLGGARALLEQVLAVREQTLPSDHPWLQSVRANLAGTMRAEGDLGGARALQEQVLVVYERTLPSDHPTLQTARADLATTMFTQGAVPAARALEEQVLAVSERTLPADHPDLLRARGNLASTLTRERSRGGASEVTRSLLRGTLLGLGTDHRFSGRQWEEFSARQEWSTSWCLSFAAAAPEALSIEEQYELVESLRCTGASFQRLTRQLVPPPELQAELEGLDRAVLDQSWRVRTAALRTTPVGEGESGKGADALQAFGSLQRELERLQTERSARLQKLARAQGVAMEPTVEAIAAALPDGAAAVGFWRYRRWPIDFDTGEIGAERPSYLAFVVRKDAPAKRVELGEAAAIERALTVRRVAIGAPVFRGIEVEGGEVDTESVAGQKVRELVFDPLRDALGDCRHVILALDSTLHLVPFGGLPGSAEHGEEGLLAESWDLEISTTLKELTSRPPKPLHPPRLVVFGGIDYDSEADPPAVPDSMASAAPPDGVDRGGANQVPPGDLGDRSGSTAADVGSSTASDQTHASRRLLASRPYSHKVFGSLDATASEADDIASRFRGHFGAEGGEPHVRLGAAATRNEFTRLAPRARFLHLATHAYVEDESIPAITDLRQQHDEPLRFLSDRRAEVRGLSPMSICGVALAGSNLRDPASGAPVGWFTAAELAELDLSGCELVVLSTCESHVGIERAGQGLASLQQAAFVAGARSTLTSIWQVPDTPTRDFMSRFYELWWDHGLTKREALVETQKWMRDARHPDTGEPVYQTRDWAAWVLVGREE